MVERLARRRTGEVAEGVAEGHWYTFGQVGSEAVSWCCCLLERQKASWGALVAGKLDAP